MATTRAELQVLLTLNDQASAKIKKSLGTVDKQTKNTTKTVAQMGRQLRMHWLAAAAAIAGFIVVARSIGGMISKFAEFEKGLANIKILLGENKKEIVLFETEIRRLAVTFGIMTDDLSKAAFDVQSAVGNTAKSLDILNAATKLAVAGGSDLRSTTSGLVTLMESYGNELNGATDAADLLFIAQVRARATIGELASSVGSFLPLAAKLKIGVEDVLASFAKMTVVLGNVNESSTAMTGILNGIIKPTKELKTAVQEWFGVSVQQAVQQGKFLDLMERLGEVSEEEIGRMIPRIRGLKGLLAVSQAISDVQTQSAEFKERAGITDRNAAEQMETTKKKLDKLAASWHDLNLEIGGAIAQPTIGLLEAINREVRFGIETFKLLVATNKAAQRTEKETDIFSSEAEARAQFGIPGIPTDAEQEKILLDMETRVREWEAKMSVPAEAQAELDSFFGFEDAKITKLLQTTEIGTQIKRAAVLKELEIYQSQAEALDKSDKTRLTKLKAIEQAKNKIFMESTMLQIKSITMQATSFASILSGFLAQAQGEGEKYKNAIKAVNIATAIMNTALAVTSALTTQPFVPVGIAMGVLAAAAGAMQIATIAAAAQGGTITASGATLVGERGPEIVDFPRGARITPLVDGGASPVTGGMSINIENASFGQDQGVEEVFAEISELLEEKRRGHI